MQQTKGWLVNKKGSHLANYRNCVIWRMKVVEVECVTKVGKHLVSPMIFVIVWKKIKIVLFSYLKAENVIDDEGFDLLYDQQYDTTYFLDAFVVAVLKAPFLNNNKIYSLLQNLERVKSFVSKVSTDVHEKKHMAY